MNRNSLAFAVPVLLTLCTLTLGCASPGGSRAADPASGDWAGHWYAAGSARPAGTLQCRMERLDRDTWLAVFEARASVEAVYEMKLEGQPTESGILFGGDIDLGPASGGVYQWTGEADGWVFQGTYERASERGRFELRRVQPPSAASPGAAAGPAPTPDDGKPLHD